MKDIVYRYEIDQEELRYSNLDLMKMHRDRMAYRCGEMLVNELLDARTPVVCEAKIDERENWMRRSREIELRIIGQAVRYRDVVQYRHVLQDQPFILRPPAPPPSRLSVYWTRYKALVDHTRKEMGG